MRKLNINCLTYLITNVKTILTTGNLLWTSKWSLKYIDYLKKRFSIYFDEYLLKQVIKLHKNL